MISPPMIGAAYAGALASTIATAALPDASTTKSGITRDGATSLAIGGGLVATLGFGLIGMASRSTAALNGAALGVGLMAGGVVGSSIGSALDRHRSNQG